MCAIYIVLSGQLLISIFYIKYRWRRLRCYDNTCSQDIRVSVCQCTYGSELLIVQLHVCVCIHIHYSLRIFNWLNIWVYFCNIVIHTGETLKGEDCEYYFLVASSSIDVACTQYLTAHLLFFVCTIFVYWDKYVLSAIYANSTKRRNIG